jgi:peptide/nickel transport system ATP-binding protein
MAENQPLIKIENLSVDYWQQGGWIRVIEDLNLNVGSAETFGLVGESGCGKSTTANAILGFRPRNSRYASGAVWFQDKNLLKLPARQLQRIRGASISLVPQNPTTALSPGMKVGRQITETLQVHHCLNNREEARQHAIELFRQVSLQSPDQVYDKYPHQLSGGQQQRAVIAMALACDPEIIVLDEPTTGLDVTTQAQILDLLVELRNRYQLTMFYITHNLGVVAQICTRIGVMYAGRLVEVAPTEILFHLPNHPYTQGLIASVPRISTPARKQTLLLQGLLRRDELPAGCQFAPRCEFAQEKCFTESQPLATIGSNHEVACWRWEEVPPFKQRLSENAAISPEPSDVNIQLGQQTLLTVRNLEVGYGSNGKAHIFGRKPTIIVNDVSFDILPGETVALVGESGSGKTTIARALSGLAPYVEGKLQFTDQNDLTRRVDERTTELLRSIQLIFQNPDASLNPRQRVSKIIGQPLKIFFGLAGDSLKQRVINLLDDVRLDQSYYGRFPDELSGGERQRVAIARALAAEPILLLCDEVLSALDVSVQANILELMVDLQNKRGIAYLFISHDLAVVRSIAHRVGVLYWGSLCEIGEVEEVFNAPSHPYTDMLLRAVPEPDPGHVTLQIRKDVGLLNEAPKTACPFAPRCPWKVGPLCEEQAPPWQSTSPSHKLRCHIPIQELYQRNTFAVDSNQ